MPAINTPSNATHRAIVTCGPIMLPDSGFPVLDDEHDRRAQNDQCQEVPC